MRHRTVPFKDRERTGLVNRHDSRQTRNIGSDTQGTNELQSRRRIETTGRASIVIARSV